ncbi:MAG: glycosyltransferase [Pseudomonadota bacterium]
MAIQHFVVTRFGISVKNPVWYEYRRPFIRDILMPSLRAQTDQEFVFLCLVDEDFEEAAYNDIFFGLNDIRFEGLKTAAAAHGQLENILQRHSENGTKAIVSRIDDDDAVYSGAIEKMKLLADKVKETTIFALHSGIDAYLEEQKAIEVAALHGSSVFMTTVGEISNHPFTFGHHQFREHAAEHGLNWSYVLQGSTTFHYTQHKNSGHVTHAAYTEALKRPKCRDITDKDLSLFGIDPDAYRAAAEHTKNYAPSKRFEGGKATQTVLNKKNDLFREQRSVKRQLRDETEPSKSEALSQRLNEIELEIQEFDRDMIRRQ